MLLNTLKRTFSNNSKDAGMLYVVQISGHTSTIKVKHAYQSIVIMSGFQFGNMVDLSFKSIVYLIITIQKLIIYIIKPCLSYRLQARDHHHSKITQIRSIQDVATIVSYDCQALSKGFMVELFKAVRFFISIFQGLEIICLIFSICLFRAQSISLSSISQQSHGEIIFDIAAFSLDITSSIHHLIQYKVIFIHLKVHSSISRLLQSVKSPRKLGTFLRYCLAALQRKSKNQKQGPQAYDLASLISFYFGFPILISALRYDFTFLSFYSWSLLFLFKFLILPGFLHYSLLLKEVLLKAILGHHFNQSFKDNYFQPLCLLILECIAN